MTEFAFDFETKKQTRVRQRQEVEARYPARIARQLALAHALQRRVDAGEFADYATMSRALGLTRARITQLMDLLLLAPDIQEEILFMQAEPGEQPIAERTLRTVVQSLDWPGQRVRWRALLSNGRKRAA